MDQPIRPACFTFVGDDESESRFVLGEQAGRIAAAAGMLRGRFRPRDTIGLLYRTSPDLLIAWLAAITAGLRPLVMQYPTRKQTRTYWRDSVANTVGIAALAGLIADNYTASLAGTAADTVVVRQAEIDALPSHGSTGPTGLPADFEIVQLSSGTTGFRKAIRFSGTQLRRHIADYNTALGLTPQDTIASWLPLYHDMGYVACFVMPLLLGVDVVAMDPMTWVRHPPLLFDAIERHGATVCYMPNFGFEVMARGRPRSLPTMRRWISCSEPVSWTTAKKFLAAVGADPMTFNPCYAMAENVFAVTFGQGCRTREIDGASVVSCGRPIAGVDVRIVGGEICVRSPTSLVEYMGGSDLRDADGFYPTGDLGELIDGELFVAGRKQDLLIQAGRKIMLTDVDLRLNELLPDIRGRAATLAVSNASLGTEAPLILIESPAFFARTDAPAIAEAVSDATSLNHVEVAFVPPRFLTKTSSGKINRRKTLADWQGAHSADPHDAARMPDARAEMRESFTGADWNRPVGEVLDSLSLAILQVILASTDTPAVDPSALDDLSLAAIDGRLAAPPVTGTTPRRGVRIVSLADQVTLWGLTERHLAHLAEWAGCEVTLEHVCLPPSPVVLSDLIFLDYFGARLDHANLAAAEQVMERVKGASMLLVDDMAELWFLYESTYPVLSHNLERDPRADLISFRWQYYTRQHDSLPLGVVGGIDIPLAATNVTLDQLGRYLNVPIFRLATIPGLAAITAGWDCRLPRDRFAGVDPDRLVEAIGRWLGETRNPPRRRVLRDSHGPLMMSDLAHFCSHMVSKEAVEFIIDRFKRFCIAGERASAPYLARRLGELGKPHTRVPSGSPRTLAGLRDAFDCLLLCGPVGDCPSDIPVVALQHADVPWRTRNLGAMAELLPPLDDMPVSSEDWFHTFDLARKRDYGIWLAARNGDFRGDDATVASPVYPPSVPIAA